jgi:putative transposase
MENESRGSGQGRYRRRLPHVDIPGALQVLTFRLDDSLPAGAARRIVARHRNPALLRKAIEVLLDRGYGCCALAHPEFAAVMRDTILHHQGVLYEVIEWVIMPNHVHLLVRTIAPLGRIVHSLKSYTARWARVHDEALGLRLPEGAVWQAEYWDRMIRSDRHLEQSRAYIRNNPVQAGLCATPEDWPWSSASRRQG